MFKITRQFMLNILSFMLIFESIELTYYYSQGDQFRTFVFLMFLLLTKLSQIQSILYYKE